MCLSQIREMVTMRLRWPACLINYMGKAIKENIHSNAMVPKSFQVSIKCYVCKIYLHDTRTNASHHNWSSEPMLTPAL